MGSDPVLFCRPGASPLWTFAATAGMVSMSRALATATRVCCGSICASTVLYWRFFLPRSIVQHGGKHGRAFPGILETHRARAFKFRTLGIEKNDARRAEQPETLEQLPVFGLVPGDIRLDQDE